MTNTKGKFIVLDGGDGSGKTLQTKLLVERLKKEGYQVKVADFPQYGNPSATFVERYLRGEFGSSRDVKPEQASLFYALDRYSASFQIKEWLQQGFIVISNRYVSANKGHQLGKISDQKKRKEFLDWLNTMEYSILEIPIPDVTIYLHMAPEIGQKLVDKKESRPSINGKKRDIHEEDLEHLKDAEQAYLFCLKNDTIEHWKEIICFSGDQPRDMSIIHQEIYKLVLKKINQK